MAKILVTGGAGFVGSHLCERLANDNEVWSIDNYTTGTEINHVPNVNYVRMSTHEILSLQFNPDLIYHLGEYARVEQSFEDVRAVFRQNSIGTIAVCEFAKEKNAKLVYAGSSTKFGDVGPNSSPYAFTKSTNTQLVQNYGDWYGLKYAITYFYNVYGKREISEGNYATLIAKFLNLHKQGKDLPVTLPGTQLRNFTHVDDIVDGLVLVGATGLGDGYGIGSDEKYSIVDVVEMIGGSMVTQPEKKGNRKDAELVTDKTKALGWSPQKHLKDYIRENTL